MQKRQRRDLEDPMVDADGIEISVPLKKPRVIFGELTDRLYFYREPNLDDFVEAEQHGEMGTLRVLISRCCGITIKEAGSLHPTDFKAAGEVIKRFLGTDEISPIESETA